MSRDFYTEISEEMFNLLDACTVYLTAHKTGHKLPSSILPEQTARLKKKVVDCMNTFVKYRSNEVGLCLDEIRQRAGLEGE